MRVRYFTFRKAALAARQPGQLLRFAAGKGYWLAGRIVRPLAREFTMYDSVNISEIPLHAVAVAGYVGGQWPTFDGLAGRFPHAKRLSIAVNATEDAACLDIEQGDATVEQVAGWVRRQQQRGVRRPVVYSSLAQMSAVLAALERAGVSRGQVRVWTAHYTFNPHRCGPGCGYGFTGLADATQYTNRAFGHNLDASLCSPRFL